MSFIADRLRSWCTRRKAPEEEPEERPGPGIRTMLIVGRRSTLADGTLAVVGHVIMVWWN